VKLIQWGKRASIEKQAGKMLRVNEQEALQIIASLTAQLIGKNPNTGRAEFQCDLDGAKPEKIYFSISVTPR